MTAKSIKSDPEFQRKVLDLLTNTDLTAVEIAEKLDVSYTTIQRTAKLLGVKLCIRAGQYDESADDQWARIKKLLVTTELDTGEIAKQCGVSRGRVQQLAYHRGYILSHRATRIRYGASAAPNPDTQESHSCHESYDESDEVPSAKLNINKLWKPARI